MKKCIICLAIIVGMLAYTQQAWAIILDFNMDALHPATASVSYAGGAAPLVGSNIGVDNVVNIGGIPILRNLSGGILSFTTGALTGSNASTWLFASGGSFMVIGGVDLNNDGDFTDTEDIPVGTTLLTGFFTGTPSVLNIGGVSKIVGASFDDFKDEKLANFYGLNADGIGYGWGGGVNLQFQAPSTSGSEFSSTTVLSGDITNEPKTPEPASMALLGLGLVGLVGRKLRRKFMA